MFDTHWNIEKYRSAHESDEHWGLRKQFMLAHKNKFPEDRLVCLTQVFFNMEFLGCRYPNETMSLVNKLATEVAKEFRDSRKGKLKRTFVGAQDAAGAKAKGTNPPSGPTQEVQNKQQTETTEDEPAPKKQCEQQISKPFVAFAPKFNTVSPTENYADIERTYKELAKIFILMIPLRANSRIEEDPVRILHYNFPNKMKTSLQGNKSEGWTCELKVNPYPDHHTKARPKPDHLLVSLHAMTQNEGKNQTAAIAVERLKKFCTYVQPNPEYYLDGETPDFIRDRIPCNKNPRSYIIVTKQETGYLTPEVANKMVKLFRASSNEEMFFPHEEYTYKEKHNLMNRCQVQVSQFNHKIGFRHFGPSIMLEDRHVCVYKKKSAEEIIEEAKKLDWKHPKYLIKLKDS